MEADAVRAPVAAGEEDEDGDVLLLREGDGGVPVLGPFADLGAFGADGLGGGSEDGGEDEGGAEGEEGGGGFDGRGSLGVGVEGRWRPGCYRTPAPLVTLRTAIMMEMAMNPITKATTQMRMGSRAVVKMVTLRSSSAS